MNGENYDPAHWDITEYGALIRRAVVDGVQMVRLVVRTDQPDRHRFAQVAKLNGLQVMGVLDRDAIGPYPESWGQRIAEVRDMYADVVDIIQPFNEPDGADVASWQMGYDTVSRGLRIARATLGPAAVIAAPGLTNSKPWYLDNIDFGPCDFVSVHLYGRHVRPPGISSFGSPVEVVERYAAISGKPVVVSEWGYLDSELGSAISEHTALMAEFLASHPRVAHGIHFCADSVMVGGFGSYDGGLPTPTGEALAAVYRKHLPVKIDGNVEEKINPGGSMKLEELAAQNGGFYGKPVVLAGTAAKPKARIAYVNTPEHAFVVEINGEADGPYFPPA
jgi:hypothetical protein